MNFDKFIADLQEFILNHPYFDTYARDEQFQSQSGTDTYTLEISTPDEEYESVLITVKGKA